MTVPGATVFTMMPSGARARDRFFEALAIAALAAVKPMSPGLWCRIDDAATFTTRGERRLAQQRQRGACGAHHREHAEVEFVEPCGVGEVVEAADVRGADGVDQHVELTPPLVEEFERRFHLTRVEQVALEADGVLGARREELLLGLAQVRRGAGEHRDPAAFGGEQFGRGPPHAACPARDDRRPSLQSEIHQRSSCAAR